MSLLRWGLEIAECTHTDISRPVSTSTAAIICCVSLSCTVYETTQCAYFGGDSISKKTFIFFLKVGPVLWKCTQLSILTACHAAAESAPKRLLLIFCGLPPLLASLRPRSFFLDSKTFFLGRSSIIRCRQPCWVLDCKEMLETTNFSIFQTLWSSSVGRCSLYEIFVCWDCTLLPTML